MRVLLCAAAFAFAAPVWAQPRVDKVDLFEAGKGGYKLYRIPGLVATPKGTLLAYCEARKHSGSDWDAIDVALRRSADGGKTWSEPRFPFRAPGPVTRNPKAPAVKGLPKDAVTYNNPVAVVHPKSGTVHVLFCAEYERCFYCRSDDDGLTFSAPVEITVAFDAFRPEYPWRVLATGPGHGIALKSGRLVVPVWLSTATGGNAHHPSVAATIVSDDQGKSWKRGDVAVPNRKPFVDPNETSAVELADGSVMLVTRSISTEHRKIVVVSPDGATRWSEPKFHPDLLEPICMASVCRLSLRSAGQGADRILFANPNTLEGRGGKPAAPGAGRERKNLSIRLTEDEGKTWPRVKTLEPGPSGYSDLAVLPDGTICCFYERWNLPDRPGYFLTVARFELEWLTAP